jgi:mono/diheme cytochrome c family protein/plastocyanin
MAHRTWCNEQIVSHIALSPALAMLFALVVPVTTVALSAGLAIISQPAARVIALQGYVAEQGGWSPGNITVQAGEKVRFELTSGDVAHGFAIGRMNMRPVRVMPGMTTTVDVMFDQPGKYTFYCTEWCSPAHWRMRGVIEVLGANTASQPANQMPDYVRLGIDIDAPHPSAVTPAQRPSATRGAAYKTRIPAQMQLRDYYLRSSPAHAWQVSRASPAFKDLDDQAVWDAVAWLWLSSASAQAQTAGASLYARNCASCHGATGKGDGPMAGATQTGHTTANAASFADAANMLGASTALLDGKVIRGGMGTGMPYWGPIFTEEQRRAVIDYLWLFQFDD